MKPYQYLNNMKSILNYSGLLLLVLLLFVAGGARGSAPEEMNVEEMLAGAEIKHSPVDKTHTVGKCNWCTVLSVSRSRVICLNK